MTVSELLRKEKRIRRKTFDPELEIVVFDVEDVIITSGGNEDDDDTGSWA